MCAISLGMTRRVARKYQRSLDLLAATRRLGVGWLWFRMRKLAGDKLGLTRWRLPPVQLDSRSLSSIANVHTWSDAEHFFAFRAERGAEFLWRDIPAVDFGAWAGEPDRSVWDRRLQVLLAGRFVYFSDREFEMGFPPDWFRNPYFDCRGPDAGHFSQLDEFQFGDVKVIWELSRFSFVFQLLRIYSRTGNESCRRSFWELFDDWCGHNPGNVGINWKCGQEAALRAIAITFGVWAFGKSSEVSSERLARVTRLMHVTGLRIEKYLDYAIMQRNNHSISESAGLWMIGLLYPELKRAGHWRLIGRKILEDQISKLFFEDGGFVQYSANYHRLAIQIITICVALGVKNDEHLSVASMSRYQQAIRFMKRFVDPVSGLVPRFGNDDGSLLFPLSNSNYDDFRPSIQAASAIGLGSVPLLAGPWDEELVWLGQTVGSSRHEPPVEEHFIGSDSGLSIIAGNHSRITFRCGLSRHRPAHLDGFHVDLWGDGINLAIDPGTFSYNGQGKFAGIPLALSRFHNSVLINDAEPAKKIGPFLFDPWPQTKLVDFRVSPSGRSSLLQGYRTDKFTASSGIVHRRAIGQLPGDFWMIIDQIDSPLAISTRLHWLLDARFQGGAQSNTWVFAAHEPAWILLIAASVPESISNGQVGCDQTLRGWFANRYLSCQPALSVEMNSPSAIKALFVSLFCRLDPASPGQFAVDFSTDKLRVDGHHYQILVSLNPQSEKLVETIKLTGTSISEEITGKCTSY